MRNTIKAKAGIVTMLAALSGAAAPAFAASGARQDNSGFAVWVFLGICALILLVQLLPVLFMAFGLVKGAAGESEKSAETGRVPATSEGKETAS